jgi:hypothetical protein
VISAEKTSTHSIVFDLIRPTSVQESTPTIKLSSRITILHNMFIWRVTSSFVRFIFMHIPCKHSLRCTYCWWCLCL